MNEGKSDVPGADELLRAIDKEGSLTYYKLVHQQVQLMVESGWRRTDALIYTANYMAALLHNAQPPSDGIGS